jgi:hypothetical protein
MPAPLAPARLDPSRVILGHATDAVKRFLRNNPHRVPVKMTGKRGHETDGTMIKSSYYFV